MSGVTVIIPLYNREKYIAEAIQSVLDQRLDGSLEIIVSDDGSTDSGVAIARSFGSPVRVILKPEGCSEQGASGARNRAILLATQPYISFLDSDDYYLPGHLNRLLTLMEDDKELGFAFCRMLEMKEVDGEKSFTPWTRARVNVRDIAYPVLTKTNIVSTNIFLFRTEVFSTVGLFNQGYSNGEDGDMWMRISELYRGAFSDHFGAIYRTGHGSGQLTGNSSEQIQDCTLKVFTAALERYRLRGVRDDYREFLLLQCIAGLKFARQSRLRYLAELGKLGLSYPKAISVKLLDYLMR